MAPKNTQRKELARETLICEYEREELSQAQRDCYFGLKEQLTLYEKKLEELTRTNQVSVEILGDMTLLEFQQLQPSSLATQRPAASSFLLEPGQQNFLLVDQNALGAFITTSQPPVNLAPLPPAPQPVGSPLVSALVRVATPSASTVAGQKRVIPSSQTPRIRMRGDPAGSTISPATGRRGGGSGGTAIRGAKAAPAILSRSVGGTIRAALSAAPPPPRAGPLTRAAPSPGPLSRATPSPAPPLRATPSPAPPLRATPSPAALPPVAVPPSLPPPVAASLPSSPRTSVEEEDIVDLTEEENAFVEPEEAEDSGTAAEEGGGAGSSRGADSREVSLPSGSERTFPSLVVLARPFIGPKAFTNQAIAAGRDALDDKVRAILTLNPAQLTEWLLQHGLLRSEQLCSAAASGGRTGQTHSPLKLGMYSDITKFPFSGGYVWISECCPAQFVSVFSGSLFEAVPHAPGTIVKLLYHWSCQTGLTNVIQWVKVDNLLVKTLYTNLRAVCTAAVHEKFPVFGGPGKRVQIGVISLGTTTQDGITRQVKVEVLGIFDDETRMIRIRAVDPIHLDPSLSPTEQMTKRFEHTLELLPKWVHKSSEIVIDYTVDPLTLAAFGYTRVTQVSPDDPNVNYTIMEYLRRIIPRMFQNTLSLLSPQIIQQFLDELSWRESFGPIPSKAFEKMVEHISEMTRLNTGGTLLNRLSRISFNPFKNWAYDQWRANCKYKTPSKNAAPDVLESENTSECEVVIPVEDQPTEAVPTIHIPDEPTPPPPPPPPHKPSPSSKSVPLPKSAPPPPPKTDTQNISRISAKKDDSLDPTMIALEPYYYGVLEGNKNCKYIPFFTQCYFCRADFKNVVSLMDHLILHALNKNLKKLTDHKDICRSCLKIRLPGSKQHHQEGMCRSGGVGGLGCRICAVKMKDKGSLVYHMTKTHHQLDMPYLCGKCGYRVSEYDLLHQHFLKMHKDGISGMCPFCLKIIDFATEEGNDLEQNQVFFTKHIQRHALPSSKKCSRCLLNFVNKSILAAHEVEMHASQSENPDVLRFLVDDPTLMPAPITEPGLCHSLQPGDLRPTGLLKGISSVSLGIPAALGGLECPVICSECESPVAKDHFLNYLMCNKCSFRTCCAHAMAEHVSLIHPPYPLSSPVHVGMRTSLSEPAQCANCSFSSGDGNEMYEAFDLKKDVLPKLSHRSYFRDNDDIQGKHLVTCGPGICHIGVKRRAARPEFEEIALPLKGRRSRGGGGGGGGGKGRSSSGGGGGGGGGVRRSRKTAFSSDSSDLDEEYRPPRMTRRRRSGRRATDDDTSQDASETQENPAASLLEMSLDEGSSELPPASVKSEPSHETKK